MRFYLLIFFISIFLIPGCSKEDNALPPQPVNSKFQGSWNFNFVYNGTNISSSCVIASNGSFSSFYVTFPSNPQSYQRIDGFVDEYGRIFTGTMKEGETQVGTFTGSFLYITGTGSYDTKINNTPVSGTWSGSKQTTYY